jgi:hypothetical protein
MIQFYLLSILCNLLGGYALFVAGAGAREDPFEPLRAFTRGEAFRLTVGMLSGVTALFKLLTAIEGDVPVIGDMVPALSGMACGISLLLEYYCSKSQVSSKALERLKSVFIKRRKAIGLLSIIAALAHFVFPRVVFL